MHRFIKKFMTPEFLRFCMVGLLNTAIDLGIYTLLVSKFNVAIFFANMASTSAALGVSYLLNASFTFKTAHNKKQLIKYVGVTIVGLWLLQPLVIFGVTAFTNVQVIPKLCAIAVTIIWNYLWYSGFVFKKTK